MRRASHGLAMGVLSALRSRTSSRVGARSPRIQGPYGATVALLIGPGNNGGDALFAGAYLSSRGSRTTAFLASDQAHPEALAAFVKAGGRWVALEDSGAGGAERVLVSAAAALAGQSDVVVDGLLGTGGRGGLRGAMAELVAALDSLSGDARPAVVACDLPSGVDATTGECHGPVLRADLTVTFGAHKSGLLSGPAEQLCGLVRLIDIGIEAYLGVADMTRLEHHDLSVLLPQPDSSDQKYSRGVAGIVAGSRQYPGAALLAVSAASACGPGMVRYLGPQHIGAAVHLRNPEVVCSSADPENVRVQAWLLGPGVNGKKQDQRVLAALASSRAQGLPVVVDAGALDNVDPPGGSENARLVLTPHAGELATMFGRCGFAIERAAVEAAPLASVRHAAQLFGAVVLLKGATTLVASPDGHVISQANGTPHLATAGSGDTLAGILVALLAMNPRIGEQQDPAHLLAQTAALGAALHGELAHESADQPLHASQLATLIPTTWGKLRAEGGSVVGHCSGGV